MEASSMAAGAEAATKPEPLEGIFALTISQAARACGVNRRTIRRHREAGDFPGAFKDEEGIWQIPIAALEAAGFPPYLAARLDESAEAIQLDRLRGEVRLLRARLQAIQAVAREREERIADLRLVLRMLPGAMGTEGGPSPLAAGARGTLPPRGTGISTSLGSAQRGVMLGSGGGPLQRPPERGGLVTSRRGREATGMLTRTTTAEEAEALIWLPESQPVAREEPPSSRPSGSADDEAIWMPGGTLPARSGPPAFPDDPPRLGRSPIPTLPEERPRRWRLGWLPWRRYRG